jgi:hypothetical protein
MFAKCVADIRSASNPMLDYADLHPAMATATTHVGCGPDVGSVCDGTRAYLACLEALPVLLDGLGHEMRTASGLLVGINLTPDGVVEFSDDLGDGLDFISVTNNWVHDSVPRAWDPTPHRMVKNDIHGPALAGYGFISGPYQDRPAVRSPSATEQRGNAWWLVAEGSVAIRHLLWPPTNPAVLDALTALETEFAELEGVVPGGRLEPMVPTSTPEVVARAFRGEGEVVLVVVNRSDRRQYAQVDLRGLVERPLVSSLDDASRTEQDGDVLSVALESFAATVVRIVSAEP